MSIAIPRPISRQRGFSLIEVSIVAAIILLAAIIGIPAIGNYVIENKVPEVGRELQRFVVRTKTNAQGAGTTPYAEVDTGRTLKVGYTYATHDQGSRLTG